MSREAVPSPGPADPHPPMTDRRPLIAVMGPTAAGKTGVAIEAARRLGLTLVSVDSAQVYRGLDIGTAKPTPAEQAIAPHRLIDLRDPWERYSAADFRTDALAAITAIERSGGRALLVGGTMLYYRALFGGLSPLPSADPVLREALARRGATEGWPALHRELAALDPAAGERIHPNDPQRIQRALEVVHLTGRPLSALQRGARSLARPVRRLVLCPAERAVLHERIRQRRDAMFEAGFVAEVEALRQASWFDPDLPALRAVGYRQVIDHLSGCYDLATARERVLFATRQLAKRQLTWLRKEPAAVWVDPVAGAGRERALDLLSRWHD